MLPRRESNPQAKVFTPSPQPKLLLLPISPRGIPCILQASPKPSELFCPAGHPFLSSFALLFRSFNTPLLPWLIRPTSLMSHSSLGLTLLPIPVPVAPRPTRERLDSEITLLPPAVLTDWIPSLSTPSVCWSVSMPFRGGHSRYGYPGDTIHHVTLFLPTYRDCTLHVPWRLRKVRDSNPRAIADLLLSREPPYHSANLPFVTVPCDSVARSCCLTSAASCRHTRHF